MTVYIHVYHKLEHWLYQGLYKIIIYAMPETKSLSYPDKQIKTLRYHTRNTQINTSGSVKSTDFRDTKNPTSLTIGHYNLS